MTLKGKHFALLMSGWLLGLGAYALDSRAQGRHLLPGDLRAFLLDTAVATLIEFLCCWFLVHWVFDRPTGVSRVICVVMCGLSGAVGLSVLGILLGDNLAGVLSSASGSGFAAEFVVSGLLFGLGLLFTVEQTRVLRAR